MLGYKVSVAESWSLSKSDPHLAGDRACVQSRADYILGNNPTYFQTPFATNRFIASTSPNIFTAGNANLTLKPQFAVNGVPALNSCFTYLPIGSAKCRDRVCRYV